MICCLRTSKPRLNVSRHHVISFLQTFDNEIRNTSCQNAPFHDFNLNSLLCTDLCFKELVRKFTVLLPSLHSASPRKWLSGYVPRGKIKRIKLSRLNFILLHFQKGLNYINDKFVFEFPLLELQGQHVKDFLLMKCSPNWLGFQIFHC